MNSKRKIKCDVNSCIYHDKDSECTADSICVDCSKPSDSCDAMCSTFQPEK